MHISYFMGYIGDGTKIIKEKRKCNKDKISKMRGKNNQEYYSLATIICSTNR